MEEPVVPVSFIAVSVNPSIRINGWEDLKGFKLTYELGTKYIEEDIYSYVDKADVIVATQFKQAIELIRSGRVDLYLEMADALVFVKLLPEYKNTRFYNAGKLGEDLFYTYVNRKYSDLAAKLAETIRAIKADGTYHGLLRTISKDK